MPKPRHRRGNALRGGHFGPAPRFDVSRACDHLAFEQHPAQHVLRRTIALLGGGAVELGRRAVVLLDAFALEIERGEIALTDRIAGLGRERQPLQRQRAIALRRRGLRKSRRRYCSAPAPRPHAPAGPRSRAPCVVAAARGLVGLRHRSATVRPRLVVGGRRLNSASASSQRIGALLARERLARLAMKAASSSRQRRSRIRGVVLDAADHRHRQLAKCRRQRGERPSAAARPGNGRMARPALGIVSSGSAPEPIWLAQPSTSTAKRDPMARRQHGQHAAAPRLRSPACGRASSRSVGSRSASRSGSR